MGEQKKNRPSKPKQQNQLLRYSGLAFQLFAIIGIGSYLGYWLDGQMGNKTPYMLLLFMLLFTGGALYSLYRQLPKD